MIIQSQKWMNLILQDGRYQGDPTVPGVSARYVDEIPYGFVKVNDFDSHSGYLLVDEQGIECCIDMMLGDDPKHPDYITGCFLIIEDEKVIPVKAC